MIIFHCLWLDSAGWFFSSCCWLGSFIRLHSADAAGAGAGAGMSLNGSSHVSSALAGVAEMARVAGPLSQSG